MRSISSVLWAVVLLTALPAVGEPLPLEQVPDPLRAWVPWVLQGREAERCPTLHGIGERRCVWVARLALELGPDGGRFEQVVTVSEAEALVTLPGDESRWPENVRVDGKAAPVLPGSGRPALRLPPGRHRVEGVFRWVEPPSLLAVPNDAGLLSLVLDGEPVPFPRRDEKGRLWLRRDSGGEAASEDRVSVEVQRLLQDDAPLRLTTRVVLDVAGRAREVELGPALPEGFALLGLGSPLPARLEADGTLRVQVRPGRHVLELRARHEGGPVSEVRLAARSEGALPWDVSEVWSFEARPILRVVEVEGVPAVDPSQTDLPAEWRTHPAYRVDPGDTLGFTTRRRGSEGAAADQLELVRGWILDFDGTGATVIDRLSGDVRTSTRLEVAEGTLLGRAAIAGRDQPVTRRAGSETLGIEVPLGRVAIDADSRVESGISRLSAVGWQRGVSALSATLDVPPGFRLFHARGADRVTETWLNRWTLLDLFVVLVVSMAFFRLLGPAVGALSLLALALTYTEMGAPRLVWLAVVATEALRRVVPAGRLATAVAAARVLSLVALVLLAIPFALTQVRSAFFPALELPYGGPVPLSLAVQEPAAEEMDMATAPRAAAPSPSRGRYEEFAAVTSIAQSPKAARAGYAPDPDAVVQTGPGRPAWQWRHVTLEWSGPVSQDAELALWWMRPWLTRVFLLVGTGLLLALAALVLRPQRHADATPPAASAEAALRAAALALAVGLVASPARAELPSPELLEELQARLLAPHDCAPRCAVIPRLEIDVRGDRLNARMAVEASVETAVPLPGDRDGFSPDRVRVGDAAPSGLTRSRDGRLWLLVGAGTHDVRLSGPLPARETLEIPLNERPRRIRVLAAEGWTVQGAHADGRAEGALRLTRDAARADASEMQSAAVPPFVDLERRLALGLRWETHTRVTRVAPEQGALVVEVPLLPGESVTTEGVRVRDGVALVTLQPGVGQLTWRAVLEERELLELVAPRDVAWSESWVIDPSPLWHVETSGIPSVDSLQAGTRRRAFRPWPGETLRIDATRPEGAGGGTLTVDATHRSVRPGPRSSESELFVRLRSSQGGSHDVTLPEGAELTEVRVEGELRPVRQENGKVRLSLRPGAQDVSILWREPVGIASAYGASAFDLGLESVNAHAEIEVPPSRWILWASGPRLGPAVLFWPLLVVVALLAAGLARLPWAPLRAHEWFLLGIGLTQAPLVAAGCVVAWLLALGLRRERGAQLPAWAFDLGQLVLAGLTVVALGSLFLSIRNGLLGLPEMQVAGGESEAYTLRWYQDRSSTLLPQPSVISVSIWWYRAAMLAWALWVAAALLRWLRWGWSCFSDGELWRPLGKRASDAVVGGPPAGP